MSKGHTLQDPYLNILRKERVPVSIYLVNGIKLQGQIESFDQFVVLLKNTVSQMVYKHAISTVVPSRVVRVPLQNPQDDDEDAADAGVGASAQGRSSWHGVSQRLFQHAVFNKAHEVDSRSGGRQTDTAHGHGDARAAAAPGSS